MKFTLRFYLLILLLMVCSLAAGYHFGVSIHFEAQAKLLDTLRDTSAVLMAVLGVWLAVTCPEILQKLFNGENVALDQDFLDRFRMITIPLFIYSIIICLEILIPWLAIIFKQIPLFLEHVGLMRQISFFVISLLCLIQVLSIILVLAPLEIISFKGKINQKQLQSIANR